MPLSKQTALYSVKSSKKSSNLRQNNEVCFYFVLCTMLSIDFLSPTFNMLKKERYSCLKKVLSMSGICENEQDITC